MRRRRLITIAAGSMSAVALGAPAVLLGQSNQLPLIAMLIGSNPKISSSRFFLEGLSKLGYVESKDYRLEVRYAEQHRERLRPLAKELVSLHPTVIFADALDGAVQLSQVTSTIPIVCAMMVDPVKAGLAASMAHPGGNVTGLAYPAEGMVGKEMEIAAQAIADPRTVGLLLDSRTVGESWEEQRTEGEAAARKLAVTFISSEVHTEAEIEAGFDYLVKAGAQVIVVPPSGLFVGQRKRLIASEEAARLPVVFPFRFFATDGGYISYGMSPPDNFRRAATYVVKILKGAEPGSLPIEFPTKFELVVNLKTAKALGINVPPDLLARADEVIE
jgi:putative tryptophan/tyrosine transport system substrate-binding protein